MGKVSVAGRGFPETNSHPYSHQKDKEEMPVKALAFAILLSLSCFGCGGGSSGPGFTAPQNADVSGPWQAKATSNMQGVNPVFVEANFVDSNGAVTSTTAVVIGSCLGSGLVPALTGTVTGNNVSFSGSYQGVVVSLTGTVSGSTMTGTYTASGACGADSGSWTATKMPLLSGNYAGNLFSNSNPAQPIPATATISTSANFAITGSASVSSVCFNQFSLSGTQVGGAGEITATDPQGDTVTFLFASQDAAFGSIAGTYSVTAGPSACNGDAGMGTLTKQ
jgi:hypothetical protein